MIKGSEDSVLGEVMTSGSRDELSCLNDGYRMLRVELSYFRSYDIQGVIVPRDLSYCTLGLLSYSVDKDNVSNGYR